MRKSRAEQDCPRPIKTSLLPSPEQRNPTPLPVLDFASPFRFPPAGTEGIVVIRPHRPVLSAIKATLQSVLAELTSKPLAGVLWIVEPGRIRVYDPHDEPT
jgi:hypothetical protein